MTAIISVVILVLFIWIAINVSRIANNTSKPEPEKEPIHISDEEKRKGKKADRIIFYAVAAAGLYLIICFVIWILK